MKCSKCGIENRVGAKFCNERGNKLEIACSNCGIFNPPASKFCDDCGHPLGAPPETIPKELSFDEKIEKIQRYLPQGLTEKILSQRDRIEGERKQVTVMFCDMEGFTALSEKLGPEEAYSIMDQVYEILIHKVHDYEGTVNEMTGDGIMALFGAPIALEDAPQRAIRSSLAIHRGMTRFNDKLRSEGHKILPLKMRIGIHTGPVVVGTLGNDLRVEFKAVGDTVNLTSRIESLAEPGTTYVSEEILKIVEGLFRFEALGERAVKGKEKPVRVYRVIAPSNRRTRFDVSTERGLTTFVGKQRELELLLDGFVQAKSGRGQVFSIVSEAGGGKSRLLYEFRKAVSNEDVTFLEGKSLSYSKGVAYCSVIDILKSNFDIREENGYSEITEKVKNGLKALEADEDQTLPYILELLSVKDSGVDQISVSPEDRKIRTIEVLKRIVLKGSEARPLIMAIEDLHWIDKNSRDLLLELIKSISGAAILLLLTYRPDFVPPWGTKSYLHQINLNRLSNRESLYLVKHLLNTKSIDENLEKLILTKTDGNPFYIEEFSKFIRDLGLIERKKDRYYLASDIGSISVPSSIQEVIMARVDSLPEEAKEVLQTGSVVEREFSFELIRKVTDQSDETLVSTLSILKDAELLYERGIFPQTTFIFKHALTREVLYDSILTRKRMTLHRKIGDAIENLYKDKLDEHLEILAEHFIVSENYEKAAGYLKKAAKQARKSASYYDAIEYAQKRVSCLERLPRTDDVQREIINARTSLANYCLNLNFHIEAKDAVMPIAQKAEALNYKDRLGSIYLAIGSYFCMIEEDYSKGLDYLYRARDISEETESFLSFGLANYLLGSALSWDCQFEKALFHYDKALELSTLVNDLVGISFTNSSKSALVYLPQGKIDFAYKLSQDSLIVAEKSEDIRAIGMAQSCHGSCCYCKGLFAEAEKYLHSALDLCEKTSHIIFQAWSAYYLGQMYFDLEKYRKSEEFFKATSTYIDRSQWGPSWSYLARAGRIRAKVLNKDSDFNMNDLFAYSDKIKLKNCSGPFLRYIGEALLNIDSFHQEDAEFWIIKAIDSDRANGMRWDLAQDYALYSKLFRFKEDQSKAKDNLGKAIEIFKECGADGWVDKYEKELAFLQ